MNPCLQPGKECAESKHSALSNSVAESLGDSSGESIPQKYFKTQPLEFIKLVLSSIANSEHFNRPAIALEKLKIKYRIRPGAKTPALTAVAGKESLALIAFYLRESTNSVESILARNAIFFRQLELRRDRRVARKRIVKHCREFRIGRRQDYRNLLRADKRSRILASYHFGDYVYGMNAFACLEDPKRQRYVLSQSAAKSTYFENLRNGLGASAIDRTAELICSETKAEELSRLLRNGNSTLVLFCDLPIGFGEWVEVKFLGRIARFPKGPALLAISNKAPLLPVINFNDGSVNRIELGVQIEPRLNCDESLQAGVTRITQDLIHFFEHFVKKYPEQWRYLANLPAYYLKE